MISILKGLGEPLKLIKLNKILLFYKVKIKSKKIPIIAIKSNHSSEILMPLNNKLSENPCS
jgi:hypothetical protein